jgi:hypothetical protein
VPRRGRALTVANRNSTASVNCTDRLIPPSGPTEPGPPQPAAPGRTLFAGLILIVAAYVAVRAVMTLRALRLIRVPESGPSGCRLGVRSGLSRAGTLPHQHPQLGRNSQVS